MYERLVDGRYNFVLIDFDMATSLDPDESSNRPTSKDRPGTLPFMARDLIYASIFEDSRKTGEAVEPPKFALVDQCLRHDLESVLYVCVWILCTFVHNELSNWAVHELEAAMKGWETGTYMDIYMNKVAFIHSGIITPFSPVAAALKAWLHAWLKFFRTCEGVRDDYQHDLIMQKLPVEKFDHETMGGNFTAANLKASLTPYIPLDDHGKVLSTFGLAHTYNLVPGTEPADHGPKPIDTSDRVPRGLEVPDDRTSMSQSETAVGATDARQDPSATAAGTPTGTALGSRRETPAVAAGIGAKPSVVDASVAAAGTPLIPDHTATGHQAAAQSAPAEQPRAENIRSRLRARSRVRYF